MDFPVFHLDFLGNRLLIALIAILHTVINHPLAVGGLPLIALMEWWGHRKDDPRWDRTAKKILFVFFIITTSFGALTGVGIWLSTSLVNPTAIGSLIRVFFWAWFTEWIVFVTEVCLILAYYLTWDRWSGILKGRHIRFGFLLAGASWATMAIIVAILSFMMDTGNWLTDRSLLSAVLNPVYLPQLSFRTPLAMVMAGAAALFILAFESRKNPLRDEAVKLVCRWMLAWSPFLAAGSYWYWRVIPKSMVANMSTALTTQAFTAWYDLVLFILLWSIAFLVAFAGLGAWKPKWVWRPAMIIPFFVLAALLADFERAREFIRKPYAIANYLYANGFRKDDYPLLQSEGILKYATFASIHSVTPENRVLAGREVFVLACTRCHTVGGVNSIVSKLKTMYGACPWNEDAISSYLASIHQARSFMPPFPGNEAERKALASYLVSLQTRGDFIQGAQTIGINPGLTQ
ncbi:MAG: c-type cytochrome [Oligoflexia bacterium]|nr:c-type cytochrome [Oligoflexia bacterium]